MKLNSDFGSASWAKQNGSLPRFTRGFSWLKDRFDVLLIAVCTQPMRWLGVSLRFNQRINESRRVPRFCQLVSHFVSIPCFEISNLLFKVIYLAQQRRMLRLGFDCSRVSGNNGRMKFVDLSFGIGRGHQILERLHAIRRELESGYDSSHGGKCVHGIQHNANDQEATTNN